MSDEAVAGADACLQIPMAGVEESLNLGTSTGIVLSYIGNQRHRFIYDHKKVRFSPKSAATEKMKSWHDFMRIPKNKE